MKIYLLTCSDEYYPMDGTGDWKGIYPSLESAKDALLALACTGIIVEIDTETMKYAKVYARWHEDGEDTGEDEEGIDTDLNR